MTFSSFVSPESPLESFALYVLPVQVVVLRAGHDGFGEVVRVVVGGRRVVAEAVEGNLLLGHHLDGVLVHLGVVNSDPAEDGERLEQADVRLNEAGSAVLKRQIVREIVTLIPEAPSRKSRAAAGLL